MAATTGNKVYIRSKRQGKGRVTLTEEYEFFILMIQVVEGLLKVNENELRPLGLSPIQLGVMYVVKTAKDLPIANKIARRLLRSPQSVQQLLDRMENQGLVRRIRTAKGKREVPVELTEKGEEAFIEAGKKHVIPEILGQLSLEERKQVRGILEKLRIATYEKLAPQPSFP